MKIRAIIADDEPLARERVRSLLAEEPDIELVAECGNGTQALNAVRQFKPDLLFLDVQMPRLNGFEVIEALIPDELPEVIFTTAHDEHAIRAFEVNALDYLLKPWPDARFKKAVQRVRDELDRRRNEPPDPRIAALLNHLRRTRPAGLRILIRTPERILFLKPEEIDHLEAAGNYVVVQAGKERHIVRETTATMEARLEPAGFMRVNRSAIVNLARVKEVQPLGAGQYCVLLKNGARFDMTCSLRELQARLAGV